MKRSEITQLLSNGLGTGNTAGNRVSPEDIEQAIRAALHALQETRPYYQRHALTLLAEQAMYEPPADFYAFDYSAWGTRKRSYEHGCGIRPHIHTVNKQIEFAPAPTAMQLSVWGSAFDYSYKAKHRLTEVDSECTLQDKDESLLLLRANAELMRLLASRNTVDPVQLHHGIGNVPTSSTPGEMYQSLMLEYRRQAQEAY